MFCSNCGNNCNPEHKFCNNCGALISAPISAPVVEPAAPVVEPAAPVVEPAAPVVEPAAPVVEPAAPVVEPVAPVVEPAAPVVEPVAPVVEPVAPVVEPVAPVVEPVAPVVEPVAPVVEPVAPVVELVAPVVEPVCDTSEPAPSCCGKKLSLGGWIYRLTISFLPLLVTYFIIFLDSTGLFSSMVHSQSGVKTLATVLLSVIGVSVLFQIGSLIFWTISKKKGNSARDWALCFIIMMVGVLLLAVLASIGLSLFHDSYTKWYSFLDTSWAPFRYVHMLLLSL